MTHSPVPFRALAVRARGLLALGLALGASPALAHHPMGGQTPATLLDGLLSGLGHPLIEPEHLLFLLGSAAAVACLPIARAQGLRLLGLFLLTGLMGTVAGTAGVALPLQDAALAVSLLLPAFALGLSGAATPAAPGGPRWAAAAGLAGLVHGLIYGEAVIGAEPTPVLAYLAGLTLLQSGLLGAAWLPASRITPALRARLVLPARGLALALASASAWMLVGAA
ncbi:MAG: HupE/UreJ family protein [Betaproteobacteria bacterium]|nr:HupE/UreJ family protein [Betaproteobacteria bacterium]